MSWAFVKWFEENRKNAVHDLESLLKTAFDAGLIAGAQVKLGKDIGKCPHCKGEGRLGMEGDYISRGPECTACDGMGTTEHSGCVAILEDVADKRMGPRR